jgi:regulatory protein
MISVEKITKKGKKYQVTVSDGTEMLFTEDDVVRYHLLKGSTFSEDEWEEIKKARNKGEAYNKVLSYLSFQGRSYSEVNTYLDQFELPVKERKEILKKITELDFVNDKRLAEGLVVSCKSSDKGPHFIREKLFAKGMHEDVIDGALKAYTDAEEIVKIREIIDKELQRRNTYPPRKQKEQIYEKLVRDGFCISSVLHELEKTIFSSDHSDRLVVDYEKICRQTGDTNKIITRLMQKGYEYAEIKKIMESKIA